MESTRRDLARDFGCDPEEMAVVRNASEALEIMIFGIVLIGTWGILSGELMRRVERQLERWRPE